MRHISCNKLHTDDNDMMVSFDVESLFTSILRENAKNTPKKPLCLRICFTFTDRIYEQTNTTPMGSLIHGAILELVLLKLEHISIEDHQPQCSGDISRQNT